MSADLAFDLVELAPCPASAAATTTALREMTFRADAWLPEEDAELRRRFLADEAIADIAAAIGRGFHAVRARIHWHGLRRNSARPWTPEEEAELIGRYGSDSPAAIARDLGRGVSAIYARAQLLSLSETGAADYDPWEDAQIRAGYAAGVPVKQIAALIGRTLIGVRCRASVLGLRHREQPPGWTDEETNRALELAEEGHRYLDIIEMLVAEGFPRRTKAGFGPKVRRLGYGRGWGRPWLPEEEELLRRAYAENASLVGLSARIGRTMCSIRWKAGELGLQGTHARKDGWRGRVWSEAEEALLRAEFGKTPSKELAAKLGRTPAAMFSRAHTLGLQHGYIRVFSAEERRAIGIGWRLGFPLAMLARACGRDQAVISKYAIRLGIPYDSPDRPVQPTRGRKVGRRDLSLAEILELLPPDSEFDGRLEARAREVEDRAARNRGAAAKGKAARYRQSIGLAA